MEISVNKCSNCNYLHGIYSVSDMGEFFLCQRCGYQRTVPPAIVKKNLGAFALVTSDRGIQNGIYNNAESLMELDANSNENPHITNVGYSMKDESGKYYWVVKDNLTKEIEQTEWLDDLFLFNGKLISSKNMTKC